MQADAPEPAERSRTGGRSKQGYHDESRSESEELKHDNIVALYDFQEMANSVYLVMEYCNGGDLADYLHTDFGFARYLQNNMMAATLCGSPMYMAPEVIMSQHYDAKADLYVEATWFLRFAIFLSAAGSATLFWPTRVGILGLAERGDLASSPQDLRLFYEKNRMLVPNIPRETSAHLRQLLLGLLQRNYKDRMDFDEFFHHPFLDASASMKKCVTRAGRKKFSWFRVASKPSRSLPSPAGTPLGCRREKDGHSPKQKAYPHSKDAQKLAGPPIPVVPPSRTRVTTRPETFVGQVRSSQPKPSLTTARKKPQTGPPSDPNLKRTSHRGSSSKPERIFLTWPSFPSLPTTSEKLQNITPPKAQTHPRNCQKRIPVIQPPSPTTSTQVSRDTSSRKRRHQQLLVVPLLPKSRPSHNRKSLGEMPHLQEKVPVSPQPGSPAFLHRSKESAGSSSKNSSCDTDDFVMVPAQFTSDIATDVTGGKLIQDSLMGSGSSLVTSADLESQGRTPSPSPPYSSSPSPSGRSSQFSPSTRTGQSIPIPVPTQIQNYRRIEQNLQSPNQYTSPRSNPIKRSGSTSPLGFLKVSPSPPFSAGEHGTVPSPRRFSFGGAKPYTPSPQVGTIPEQSDQMIIPSPLGTELRTRVPISDASGSDPSLRGLGYRLHSAPNLSDFHSCRQKVTKQYSDPLVPHFSPVPTAQATRLPSLQSGRPLRSSPKLSEFMQRTPLPTILGSPTKARSPFEFSKNPSSQNLFALLAHQAVVITPTRNKTLPDLKEMGHLPYQQGGLSLRPMEDAKGRSLSTGRLTDLLLKAAFGEAGSNDSLNSEKPMEITVGSSSSLSSGGSFSGRHFIMGAGGEILEAPSGLRYTLADPIAANLEGAVTFEAPELPEETLMEQEHTDILHSLRFTLAFVHYVMELATIKGSASEMSSSVASEYQLQESVVADQISLLSKEWSYAEQLVLYLKVAELLSAGLQMAIDQIRAGKLCLSSTVKQIVRKLNDLYKSSVSSCHHLNLRLQRWFMDKQKLMDRINSITAEKLIFSHAVQMVKCALNDGCPACYQESVHDNKLDCFFHAGFSSLFAWEEDMELGFASAYFIHRDAGN
ncbi:Serine/threonine-protein kinase ULK1, partial [Ophiophagus hannah]